MASDTGRESDKFMLRLPDGMRDQIKRHAAENKRSMNAEIISLLEDALSHAETSNAAELAQPVRLSMSDLSTDAQVRIIEQVTKNVVEAIEKGLVGRPK